MYTTLILMAPLQKQWELKCEEEPENFRFFSTFMLILLFWKEIQGAILRCVQSV